MNSAAVLIKMPFLSAHYTDYSAELKCITGLTWVNFCEIDHFERRVRMVEVRLLHNAGASQRTPESQNFRIKLWVQSSDPGDFSATYLQIHGKCMVFDNPCEHLSPYRNTNIKFRWRSQSKLFCSFCSKCALTPEWGRESSVPMKESE